MQNETSKMEPRLKYLPTLPYLSPERSQKFFGIILTLIALSFFGFFAISPTISTILKLKKELSDNELVYKEIGGKIKNLSSLRIKYADLQNDLPLVTDAITLQPDAHLLFAQIQAFAQKSNIKLKKLQNSEVEIVRNEKAVGKQYYSFPFSVAGSGSFEDLFNFISDITNMQRVINIDLFTLNNISGQDNRSLNFTIQGITFFKNL